MDKVAKVVSINARRPGSQPTQLSTNAVADVDMAAATEGAATLAFLIAGYYDELMAWGIVDPLLTILVTDFQRDLLGERP